MMTALLRRGELYIAESVPADPRSQRVVLVVSRQLFLNANHSMVLCAPVYSRGQGIATQVRLGPEDGLKHESSLHCDDLIRLRRDQLKRWVGRLSSAKMAEVNAALALALGLDEAEQ